MRFRICFVLACSLATLAAASDEDIDNVRAFGVPFNEDLIDLVRYELFSRLNTIWVAQPPSTVCSGCLISHWASNTGSSVGRTFVLSDLDKALTGLPTDVINMVKPLVFGNKAIFEMFHHAISAPASTGHYLHYMGIVRRRGTSVDFAILKGEVRAVLVPKYIPGPNNTLLPRGYYPQEVIQMETAMRAETWARMRDGARAISWCGLGDLSC